MASNYFRNFSFKELADVYTQTIANYGKLEGELLEEINARGGETAFKAQLAEEIALHKERERIRFETHDLTNDATDVNFIKTVISSNLLSRKEVDAIIEQAYTYAREYDNNKKITPRTLVGCLFGALLGIAFNIGLSFLQQYFFQQVVLVGMVLQYGVVYLMIRLCTKQTASNWLVLLTALVATIVGVVVFVKVSGS